MDALKKAEKAKQGPNSVFGDPPPTTPSASTGPPTEWPVLSMDPKPAELEAELGLTEPPARVAKPRPDTPSTPLALDPLPAPSAPPMTEDPPKVQARAPVPELAVQMPPAANENKSASDKEFANRMAAKRVFSAKQPGAAAKARTPFYAVLGVLLLVGAGGAYYVWTETQSPPSVLAVKGPASSAAGTINGAPSAPQATPVIPAPPSPAAPPQAANPGPGATTPPAAAAAVVAELTRPAELASPIQPAPPGPPAAGPSSARPAQLAAPAPREEPAQTPNPPAVAAMQAGRNGVSARGGNPVNTPANLRITRDRPGPGVDPAVSAGVAEIDVPEAEYATAWDQTT